MTRRTVYALMALHVVCSAITYVLGKQAAVGFPSAGALTMGRALLAALLLLALTGWAIPRPRFTGRQWLAVVGLGVLLVPLNQYLFLRGLRDTVPAHPPLLYAMTPVGVLVLQSVLARRAPPRAKLAGVLTALAGVAILLRPWHEDARFAGVRTGDLHIAAGMVVWVVYTVVSAPLFRAHDPRVVTAWSLVLGAAVLAPISGWDLATVDFAAVPAVAWVALAWLAVVTSAFMMLLWNAMLRHLEPVEVAVCSNAQPATTAALAASLHHAGWLRQDQDLGPLYWLGTLLILGGVILTQRRAPVPVPEPGPA